MSNPAIKNSAKPKGNRFKRFLKRFLISILVLGILVFFAFKFSPWPSALLMRYGFEKEAEKVNNNLEKHVPSGVFQVLNQSYDPKDEDALLDVYYPSSALTTET